MGDNPVASRVLLVAFKLPTLIVPMSSLRRMMEPQNVQ